MKKWILWVSIGIAVVWVASMLPGCTKTYIIDPNDPNTLIPYYGVDPNVVSTINTGVGIGETATPVITSIGVTLFPQYAGILTLVGGAIGYGISLWRKLNPVLQKMYTKNQILQTTLSSVTKAVEAAGEATNGSIKEVVAANLKANGLETVGKILITEAKAMK